MRHLKETEHAFVEFEIEDMEWRIIQMRDKKTLKYYSKVGFKFIERQNPPEGVKFMWTLLSLDSIGGEQ